MNHNHNHESKARSQVEINKKPHSILTEPALEPTLPLIALNRLTRILADDIRSLRSLLSLRLRLRLSGPGSRRPRRFRLSDFLIRETAEAVFGLGALVQTLLLQGLLLQLVI